MSSPNELGSLRRGGSGDAGGWGAILARWITKRLPYALLTRSSRTGKALSDPQSFLKDGHRRSRPPRNSRSRQTSQCDPPRSVGPLRRRRQSRDPPRLLLPSLKLLSSSPIHHTHALQITLRYLPDVKDPSLAFEVVSAAPMSHALLGAMIPPQPNMPPVRDWFTQSGLNNYFGLKGLLRNQICTCAVWFAEWGE